MSTQRLDVILPNFGTLRSFRIKKANHWMNLFWEYALLNWITKLCTFTIHFWGRDFNKTLENFVRGRPNKHKSTNYYWFLFSKTDWILNRTSLWSPYRVKDEDSTPTLAGRHICFTTTSDSCALASFWPGRKLGEALRKRKGWNWR